MCHSRVFFVIPVKTGIQTGLDPQSEALRFRLRMTGGNGSRISSLSFPRKRESSLNGSPIRSASLSVEDDGRGWHSRVSSLSFPPLLCHSRASGNPVQQLISLNKSFQSGLCFSIKSNFQFRFHFFNTFSLSIADRILSVCSK